MSRTLFIFVSFFMLFNSNAHGGFRDFHFLWPLSGKHFENNKYCFCEIATANRVNKENKEEEIQIAKRPYVWFSTEGAPVVYSSEVKVTWHCDMYYGTYRAIIKPYIGF